MNRILGILHGRAGRVGVVAGVAIATIVALALPAGANTGHVTASQTCQGGWSVTVTLDNNTTPDHFVELATTIPGTTGIVDGHFDTTGNSGPTQIWHETGSAPSHGTVTLTILNPDRTLDSTTSGTLPDVGSCESTTSSSSSTSSTTSSTSTTTSTTTGPTSTAGATSTTSNTVGERGSTAPTSTTISPVTATIGAQGAKGTTTTIGPSATATGSLPFTGSGTMVPALFGLGSIAAGALLLLRKRTTV